jgi:hypothetical protein
MKCHRKKERKEINNDQNSFRSYFKLIKKMLLKIKFNNAIRVFPENNSFIFSNSLFFPL